MEMKEKYAELVVKTGVNLQKGQPLMINSPIECADFTRLIAKQAYEAGAKDVHINWADDELTYLKYKHADEAVLAEFPEWKIDRHESFAKDGAALLSIHATDPDLLKDIDPERVALANKASAEGLKNFRTYVMNDLITWSVISVPTKAWAKKVFPNDEAEEAVNKLWDAILKTVRVDEDDPIAAWDKHNDTLHKAESVLNDKQYESLHFKADGTDLIVGLPKDHIWQGGSAVSEKGITFNPNMPTEEVFCVPHKYDVNGTVSSTKPLNYGGNIIDDFTLTFKDGKVVDFDAKEGKETLKQLLDIDEGARRLGEVALVPHESPISQSGLTFYNTLFDENASCHLAFGKAYPTNIKGGADMSDDALDKHGVNDSLTHVDFMIGSANMSIDGIKADGTTEAVFREGTWSIDIT
ncbi:MAG TPA: aminopeptidase [Bacillota bacterium]|nr:aminopeptidase [Bacillota bacterium]